MSKLINKSVWPKNDLIREDGTYVDPRKVKKITILDGFAILIVGSVALALIIGAIYSIINCYPESLIIMGTVLGAVIFIWAFLHLCFKCDIGY